MMLTSYRVSVVIACFAIDVRLQLLLASVTGNKIPLVLPQSLVGHFS
jgi:hypothetical protein